MSIIRVPSDVRSVEQFEPADCPAEELSFYGATAALARQFGGRVTNAFLDLVDRRWVPGTYLVYSWNTRLNPGFWPTPGIQWHTDGRTGESFLGQTADDVTEHIGCSLIYEGPDDATTEFALGFAVLDLGQRTPLQPQRFNWWHYQIDQQVRSGSLETFRPRNCEVLLHDHRAFHRAPMPSAAGKRLLIGATRFPNIGPAVQLPPQELEPKRITWSFAPREDGTGWETVA